MILLIIPYPGLDCYIIDEKTTHLLSELLIACMFLRIYYIFTSYLLTCEYADAFSTMINRAYGFESAGMAYNFKCIYVTSPQKALSILFLGTIFIFSYVIRIVERPFFRTQDGAIFDSYFKAIYFTVITLTTIGYGDICPGTSFG